MVVALGHSAVKNMIFSKSEHEEIRRNFPITKKYIYFDNAGVAPISLPAMKIVNTIAKDICDVGYLKLECWYLETEKARKDAAALINSSPDEIAFVKNTSHGLSLVAGGINWRSDDEIIIADQEFPANVYPWQNLKRQGVKVITVSSRKGRLLVDYFAKAVTSKTKLISISSVEYATGFRNDIAAIGRICQKKGILFCVDAIQSLGAIPIDVKKNKIDFLAADGHKWLVAPEGIGIFFCRRSLIKKLNPVLIGWKTVKNASNYHKINFQLKQDASRFEEGSQNLIGVHALRASIRLLRSIGIERIEQWNLHLTDLLLKGLKGQGGRILNSTMPQDRSSIISFTTGNKAKDRALVNHLIKNKIIVSLRADGIRLSPHLYNTPDEIAKFFRVF